jgi:uncharacterized membrane protein YecN with MAPEG domain
MPYHVTMLYASLLGLFLIILSWGVSKVRLRERVSLGAGEVSDLEAAIRAHGNFIEYVPFALILLLLAESAGAQSWLLHALGGSLLAGRLLHAYGIRQPGSTNNYRKSGAALTWLMVLVTSLYIFAIRVGISL